MLQKHEAMWNGKLGNIKAPPHRIESKDGTKPVHAHPYRAGPHARKAEEEEVQRLLEADLSEPSQSEWASPVVLVTKPYDSLRSFIDYRKLNAGTVKETYPLPQMDECLDSVGDATIFLHWTVTVDTGKFQ